MTDLERQTDDRDPLEIEWGRLRVQLLQYRDDGEQKYLGAKDWERIIEIGDERFFPKRPPDPASDENRMQVTYTNYRGETAVREITPLSIAYGSNEWHEEPQFLLHVYDHDRGGAIRTYALKDCDFTNVAVAEKTLPEFSAPMMPTTVASDSDDPMYVAPPVEDFVGSAPVDPLLDEPWPDVAGMIADAGGTVTELHQLPDGSGFATASFPLPKDHWLYAGPWLEPPPMPFRMLQGGQRHMVQEKIRAAARYAIRASTMRGKDNDFDPDAMVQNFIVGMLGYHTWNGLTDDKHETPDPVPPIWWPDSARGDLVQLAELVAQWREMKAKYVLPSDPNERALIFNELFALEQRILNFDSKETTRA